VLKRHLHDKNVHRISRRVANSFAWAQGEDLLRKVKQGDFPLEQVFKRKRRCLLNGIEKSALLEEKKRESIAICRTTLRPSQWRLRLRVTRHTVHFSVGWKAYTLQQESAILYGRVSAYCH
jgi:hypothetical protein